MIGAILKAGLAAVLGCAVFLTGIPETAKLGAVSIAHADDDDGDDGGSRGSSYGGRGGERSLGTGSNGKPPRFLRYLQRKFQSSRPRNARSANRRAPVAQPVPAPDEVVVFEVTSNQLESLTNSGFRVIARARLRPGDGGELLRLSPPSGQDTGLAVAAARAIAPQAVIDTNHLFEPNAVERCEEKSCFAQNLIGWPTVGMEPACHGNRPVIGMIDTGVNGDHPTFSASRLETIQLDGKDAPVSDRQHGTAVAALLIGRASDGGQGLVPNASVIAVDAFKDRSGRPHADAFSLARAIAALVDRKVDVINMSLSGPDNAVVSRLVQDAHSQNIVLVAAAGNDGPKAKPVYPAAYPTVIAVTAVDGAKKLYRRAGQGAHIDLAAPGVAVWTAASIKGTRPKTGTSFASPFVAAAAAIVKSRGVVSAPEVERRLAEAAEDLGDPGKDSAFGWGLLNAGKICTDARTDSRLK